MFLVNLAKRLPKKPLIGLAVLAVALVATGGGMARRADAATTYTVEVSWNWVGWSAIDDGVFDHTAEVYGHLFASNAAMNQYTERMMGNEGHGTCTSDWSGSGPCNKKVSVGTYYDFTQTPLSPYGGAYQPASNYAFYNNKVKLQLAAGQTLHLAVDLWDYDATSANDRMCQLSGDFSFTDAQLQSLSSYPKLQTAGASDGTCEVIVHLRRI